MVNVASLTAFEIGAFFFCISAYSFSYYRRASRTFAAIEPKAPAAREGISEHALLKELPLEQVPREFGREEYFDSRLKALESRFQTLESRLRALEKRQADRKSKLSLVTGLLSGIGGFGSFIASVLLR
jgi:hypothetical protein